MEDFLEDHVICQMCGEVFSVVEDKVLPMDDCPKCEAGWIEKDFHEIGPRHDNIRGHQVTYRLDYIETETV